MQHNESDKINQIEYGEELIKDKYVGETKNLCLHYSRSSEVSDQSELEFSL